MLIDFWATWCGRCVEKLDRLQKLHEKYGKLGLQVVAVHLDNGGEACAAFARERKLSFSIAIDSGKAAEAYAVATVPCYFLIGADGKVVSG